MEMDARLQELVTAAVDLAILRHGLTDSDGQDIGDGRRAEIAKDTWDALNGVGCCRPCVAKELRVLAEALEDCSEAERPR